MKALVALCALVCLAPSLAALEVIGNSQRDRAALATNSQGDRLYSRTYKLQNAQGKTIHLVGMVHLGSAAYFARSMDYLKQAATNAGRVVVMNEFIRCSGSVSRLGDPREVIADLLLGTDINTPVLEWIQGHPATYAELLAQTSVIAPSECQSYFGVNRPAWYIDRVQRYCFYIRQQGGECQWDVFHPKEELAPEVRIIESDIDLSDPNDISPVAASLIAIDLDCRRFNQNPECTGMPVDFEWNESFTPDSQLFRRITRAVTYEYRELHVIEHIEQILSEVDTVLLPWGGYHNAGFLRFLGQRGFRIVDQGFIEVHRQGSSEELEFFQRHFALGGVAVADIPDSSRVVHSTR